MNLRTAKATRTLRAGLLITLLLALGLVLAAPALAAPATAEAGPNGPASARSNDRGIPAPVPALPNAPMGKSTIGDYVWHDYNLNGDHAVGDVNEAEFTAGFDGVVLHLERWDPNTSSWVVDGTTTTGAKPTQPGTSGWYQFPATADGTMYRVIVDPINFGPGKPLEGYVLTSATVYPEPFTLNGVSVDYKNADFGYARARLEVTKSPASQTLLPGSTATFTVQVKNTGETYLEDVAITENLAGATCSPNPIPGPIAPNGGTATTTCTYTMGTTAVQNSVSATGTPTDGNGNTFPGTPPSGNSNTVDVLPANPALTVVKEVWDGTTWQDANAAPGPNLTGNPVYRFTVKNTGNVALTNVGLFDSPPLTFYLDQAHTAACPLPVATLTPGNSFVCYATGTWAEGQQKDTATTSGTYKDDSNKTATPTATDDANYFGANPQLQVVKEVWNGTTWQDANTPTGPNLTGNPLYRFTVSNTGNVPVSNVTLSDSPALTFYDDQALTTPCPLPVATLAVNGSFTCYASGAWAAGQQTDTATTSGTYQDAAGNTTKPTDTDDANYFGADPKIQVVKEVSVDGGATWLDAYAPTGPYAGSGVSPQFRFTITNIGNVTLTNITLSDSGYTFAAGECVLPASLPPVSAAPANSYSCTITRPWASGQHTDIATTTGTFVTPLGPIVPADTDNANYFGADPKIQVVKTAGNAPDGSPLIITTVPQNVTFTYVVTNIGNTPLFLDKTGADPNYKLTDDKCSPVGYVSGDANNNNLVDLTESWTFTCTASVSQDTVNTATVKGRPEDPTNPGNPPPGTTPPSDTDTAEVKVQQSAIGDLVWWDVNGNGVQDLGEPGIPGVVVDLTGTSTGTQTTNNSGVYNFTNIPPGPYTVVIPASAFAPGGPLEGFTPSSTGQGTPATDSNGVVQPNGDVIYTFTLPVSTSDQTIDFGFVKPTKYAVEKTRLTDSPTTPGSGVHFQIKVTNTGQTWITTLPLVDTYDVSYLTYGYGANFASPASADNIDDGTINWANVAPAGGLAPSASVTVDVWFTAKADTLGITPDQVTKNTATVPQQGTKVDPDGPNGAIPPADSPLGPQESTAPVQIINPTGVVLARAGVAATANGVVVSWETADERTLLGFNVLRGASATDLKVVTSDLLLAQTPGLNAGAAYRFTDAVAAGSYYYALELVGLDGTTRRIDVGVVTVGR